MYIRENLLKKKQNTKNKMCINFGIVVNVVKWTLLMTSPFCLILLQKEIENYNKWKLSLNMNTTQYLGIREIFHGLIPQEIQEHLHIVDIFFETFYIFILRLKYYFKMMTTHYYPITQHTFCSKLSQLILRNS